MTVYAPVFVLPPPALEEEEEDPPTCRWWVVEAEGEVLFLPPLFSVTPVAVPTFMWGSRAYGCI